MRSIFTSLLFFCFFSQLFSQDFPGSTLPLLLINTEGQEIPDEPKIMARMGVIDNGSGQINQLSDPFNHYDGWIGIERRGSTSQSFPKVGYGLETREADGEGIDVALLGFPEEEDWVLHGPYSDKSLIRNTLLYDLAGQMMAYAPRVRLVEVFINDDYQGVYLFTERVKRDNNRVNIANLRETHTSGNQLTGGYLLKFDKTTADPEGIPLGFESNFTAETPAQQPIRIIYHVPKPEDILPEQRDYIENYLHAFEAALAGPNFADPVLGYRPYVELLSFVDFLILNEISKNVDGYRLSSYFSKERDSRGGKIQMGPVWDFNIAFGNADYCNSWTTTGWSFNFNFVCAEDFWAIPFWWRRLREDYAFRELLAERWTSLRAGLLSTPQIHQRIDSLVTEMGEAPQRNFKRWPVLGEYVWPNAFVGNTYEEEIIYLKNWITDRMEWLDEGFAFLTPTQGFEQTAAALLHIFPNPSDAGLHLLLPEGQPVDAYELRVHNLNGQEIFRANLAGTALSGSFYPPVAAGYYVVSLLADGLLVGREKWIKR